MTKLLILIVLLGNITFSTIAQDSTKLMQSMIGLGIDKSEQRNVLFEIYTDSINSIVGNNLPNFIFDECFDLNETLASSFHSRISNRWRVLEMVNNQEVLLTILKSKEKGLRRKCSKILCDKTLDVPFSNKSYRQLVKKRLKQLEK